jgi:hypothetical protein
MNRRGISHRRIRVDVVSRGALATGLMLILVVLAMVAAAIFSRQAADKHRRAQVLVEQLRASSEELSALKWRANTEVLSGTANFSLAGQLVGDGARILAQLNSEATQLTKLQPGPDTRHQRADRVRGRTAPPSLP